MADQANALRRRRRQNPSSNEEERWKEIYRILFPDVNETEIPSPCAVLFDPDNNDSSDKRVDHDDYPVQSAVDLSQSTLSPGNPMEGMTVLQNISIEDLHILENIVRQVVLEQLQRGSHSTVSLDLSQQHSNLMQMPPTRFAGFQQNDQRLQTAQQFEMPMFSTSPFVLGMPPEISAMTSMDINPSFSRSLVPIQNSVGMNHGLENSSGDSGYQSGPVINVSPPDGMQHSSSSASTIEERGQNSNLINVENIYSCLSQEWNGNNGPLDDI
jgi:hypothetical protein